MVNIWSIFSQASGAGCPLCHAAGDDICSACTEALPHNHHPCARCALPLPEGAPPGTCCAECQARAPAFDRALAPLRYLPPVDHLVGGFKYHHQLPLGRMLATRLADTVVRAGGDVELLLPVPLHARRLRERGFNQAAELARWLSKHLGIPWSPDRLQRVRQGDHQQGLGRRQRRRNVRGDFSCRGVVPARVALIDDVMTTGATAGEASRILRRAGAQWIEVWTVARTPPSRS